MINLRINLSEGSFGISLGDTEEVHQECYPEGHMSDDETANLAETLDGITFDNTKLSAVKVFCKTGVQLSAAQATELLRTFNFDSDRKRASRLLTRQLSDPHMSVLFAEAFNFSY
jgi:hypothetical protein